MVASPKSRSGMLQVPKKPPRWAPFPLTILASLQFTTLTFNSRLVLSFWILYKWNCTVCIILSLASFVQYYVYAIHPHCMYVAIICLFLFLCGCTLQFINMSYWWWSLEFSCLELLQIRLPFTQKCCLYMTLGFTAHLYAYLLGKYLRLELLIHSVGASSIRLDNGFSKVVM